MITRASVGHLSEGTSIVHGFALRPDASDLDRQSEHLRQWRQGPPTAHGTARAGKPGL
jgi:hypothetical protein